MFHSSTQKSHWLFDSQRDLTRLRAEANATYCQKHSEEAIRKGCQFLTSSEEQLLCQYYMKKLLEFCQCFQPPVPRSVLGTVSSYLKRVYLHTSVMEHSPKDIQFCCAYIGFKIEEYNLSIDEFVQILPKEFQGLVATLVLQNELVMLKKLKFHLIVHSPFRPMEGFIIDMKTRSSIPEPDRLRNEADRFLLKSLHSDAALLYPPSQIALSALSHSARKNNIDISNYIKSMLLGSETDKTITQLYRTLESIKDLVNNVTVPDYKEVAHIEERLIQLKSVLSTDHSPARKRKSEEQLEDKLKKPKQEFYDEESVLGEGYSYPNLQGIRKL